MLKKTALAVLALTTCGIANAAVYTPEPAPTCAPGNVTVPCEANKWDIGIQALYLRPTHDADLAYTINNFTNVYHELEHDWDWGYRLEGSYHFGTGSDVTVNWTNFDNKTHLSFDLGPANVPFINDYTLNSRFNQYNAVWGQHADFGMHKNMRFYGGVQVAQINEEVDQRFVAPFVPPTGPTVLDTTYHNNYARKFLGMGPTVGTDFGYDFGNGFSLVANAAGAMLFGVSKEFFTITNSAVPGIVVTSSRASNKIMVPEVEAKLGASYAHTMAEGVLTIDAGYQAMNYFNALTVVAGGVAGVNNSDYGLNGPYLGLKWIGNA